MAKNESSILEGLHFGSTQPVRPAETQTAPKAAEAPKQAEKPVKTAKKAAEPAKKSTAAAPKAETAGIRSSYAEKLKQKKETRSVRTTISLTPGVYERLTKATETGEIKSANDLINYLLEQYFA